MAAYFLDTSALVKRWIDDPGSGRVRALTGLHAPHHVYAARLALTEVVGAVTRRHRAAGFPASARAALLALIAQEIRQRVRVIEIGLAVWTRATHLAAVHAMRGADAVHVAAAAGVAGTRGATGADSPIFVTADLEQAAAARAEGLEVEVPTGLSV